MNLYDYQKNVITACKNESSHSQLISMPTGTGKTITFLSLAKEYNKKTLILVHREELLNQTYEKSKLCGFKEEDIRIISANKKESFGLLNIAMIQSLNRNLDKYNPDDIELIIVDEAHHATAPSYKNLFSHFKVYEEKKYLFGFTATPLRGDKDHLSSIFHAHSFKMTLSEATRQGYIVPVHGMRIEIDKSLKEIDTTQGDYDISQLDKVMNCDSINELVVERCKNLKKVPGILFCTSVNHAEELSRRLREAKRKAISISYKTPKKTLERIFKMLKEGRIDFITNAVKLSEGFDFPPIQSVILVRPTRSPVLYKQMIGRGLRNHKDKHECFVLEFTSNDPVMIKWEDIDENATFQSSSPRLKKTEEEALCHYKNIFSSPNVEILDVRLSHFEFYECKIRRTIKYKKHYYYVPFEEGFTFYELKNSKLKGDRGDGNFFHLYGSMFFWKEKYKSFYAWDVPNYKMSPNGAGFTIPINLQQIKYHSDANKLGKWLPSDLEPVTREQKKRLEKIGLKSNQIKSSRKAEMEIEDYAIKKAIDQFMSQGKFNGIMEIK